jgi:hypothetical protein
MFGIDPPRAARDQTDYRRSFDEHGTTSTHC